MHSVFRKSASVACAFCAAAVGAPLLPVAAQAPAAPIKAACVGDSITAGVGSSGVSHTHPSVLATLLGLRYQVQNFGEGGATLLKHGDSPYWQRGGLKQLGYGTRL